MFFKDMFQDKVKTFAFLVSFFPVLRVINFQGDILESYRYLSPDSLDWIIQGRIVGTEGVVIPVLRNSGYVFISKVDWLLGAHGFAFCVAAFAGMYLQFHILIELMKISRVSTRYQYFGVILYSLIFIHFISKYILPDGIAVGLICYALYKSIQGLQKNHNSEWFLGLILSIFATTLQIYAFVIFLCLIVGLLMSDNIKKIKIRRFFEITSATLFSLLLIKIWRDLNDHIMVPNQLSLLKISFDMFPFYAHTLTFVFLPLLMVLALSSFLPKVETNLVTFQKLSLISGVFLISSALFYQWPESRFTYSGIALITLAILPIALKRIDSYLNLKVVTTMNKLGLRLMLIATLVLLASFGPANPWQPRWDQIQIGRTWPNEMFYDYSNEVKSNYRDVLREIKDDCFNNSSPVVKSATILKYGRSEYEVSQLDLYATYCLFK